MKGLTLCGGLGDAFIVMHESAGYEEFDYLRPGQRARVYIISHNPYVYEIFKWHPKADQIDVFSSGYFFVEYGDARKRADSGIPPEPIDPNIERVRAPVRFYPSPEDRKILDGMLPTCPYLVVAPTASGMEIENRNIPLSILYQVCGTCATLGIPVVFVGRTYQGPHAPKDAPIRPGGIGIVDLTDKLSVPGTCEVVQRAEAGLYAHSAMLLLAWYNRKPNFVLYPPKYKYHDFDNPSPFGFGKDYPETTRKLFSEFKLSTFVEFLSNHFQEEGKSR